MKNKLIKGLFGFGLILLMTTGVNAQGITSIEEGNNSASSEVMIGNVEVPVYEAEIIWQDLTFDWAYNEVTKEFEWRKPKVCSQYYSKEEVETALQKGEKVYSDNTCENRTWSYEEGDEKTYYYIYETNKSVIGIEDMSQKGEIVPTVTWKSSEKYSHVIGKLEYKATESVCSNVTSQDVFDYAIEKNVTLYSNDSCSTKVTSDNLEYGESRYYAFFNVDVTNEVTGELPDNARYSGVGSIPEYDFTEASVFNSYYRNNYTVYLSLTNDPEKDDVQPVTGEVLGSVTISIRAR